MLSFLKNLVAEKTPVLTEKQKFEAENGISHDFGFICQGFIVDDFSHHLSFYSNGKVNRFDDLKNMILYKDEIIQATEQAILYKETGETGVNNDDKQALINARNFLKIFTTVVDYNVKFNLETFQ